MPILVQLLGCPSAEVREQAVWALGNIAGDGPRLRDYVLGEGALEPILKLITETTKIPLLRNATWTVSNFCRGKQPVPNWPTVRRLCSCRSPPLTIFIGSARSSCTPALAFLTR